MDQNISVMFLNWSVFDIYHCSQSLKPFGYTDTLWKVRCCVENIHIKSQPSLRDLDHLFGFSLSDRCLLSLEQVPIHIVPTGALVPEDCQVGNENSVAWEDMSFFGRWWKVTSTPFPGWMSYFPATFPTAH